MNTLLRAAAPLALLGLLACGGEPPPPPTPVDAGQKPVDQRPTEEQERALANELHKLHVESKEETIKCRACHAISGNKKAEIQHRCLGCHEENTSKVHHQVADKRATECLTCHDFLTENVNAWGCGSCHVAGVENTTRVKNLPDSPKVVIHGKEACKSCHVPHGDEPLKPDTCIECHEENLAKHEEEGKKDPEQCLSCHGGHEKASAAKGKCQNCHDKTPKAALFEGHEVCTTCHLPHSKTGKKNCTSCHDKQHTVGAKAHKEHAKCVSCHPAHVAKIAPPKRCVKCHEDTEVKGHPDDEKLGACAGCHPQHEWRSQLVTARSCAGSDCHSVAGDTAFHSGVDCSRCHEKHSYDVKALGNQSCLECHGSPRKGRDPNETATQVVTVKGHDQCKDCHEKGAHAPKVPPKDCNACHEEQVETMTKGHEDCAQCHLPHEGTVEKTCNQCHDDKVRGRHTEKETKDCKDCHRSHGPEGPAEPKACKSCHDEALPGLHTIRDHGRCDDCHAFHDKAPRRGRTSCLGSCHETLVDHEPTANSCVGCHPFEKDQEAQR